MRKHVAYEVMGEYGLKITKNFYQPGDHRLMRLFVFSFFFTGKIFPAVWERGSLLKAGEARKTIFTQFPVYFA